MKALSIRLSSHIRRDHDPTAETDFFLTMNLVIEGKVINLEVAELRILSLMKSIQVQMFSLVMSQVRVREVSSLTTAGISARFLHSLAIENIAASLLKISDMVTEVQVLNSVLTES